MNFKKEILKIIKEHNKGKSVSFPIIDRNMIKKGVSGGMLKEIIDSYVDEKLLIWDNSLSLKITEKGNDYLNE